MALRRQNPRRSQTDVPRARRGSVGGEEEGEETSGGGLRTRGGATTNPKSKMALCGPIAFSHLICNVDLVCGQKLGIRLTSLEKREANI